MQNIHKKLITEAKAVLELSESFEGRNVFKRMLTALTYSCGPNPKDVTFQELFETQIGLLTEMGWPGGGEGVEAFKSHLFAAQVELVEALNETPWKPWKPVEKQVQPDLNKVAAELTDAMQFIINAAVVMNLTSEDLSNALRKKWILNFQRVSNGETLVKSWENEDG